MCQPNLCGTSEGKRFWCNTDFEGISTSLSSQAFLLLCLLDEYFFTLPIICHNTQGLFFLRCFLFLIYYLCSICHIRCVFTDPGSVPSNAIPLINEDIEDRQLLMRCGICDAYKPPKSHHCKICNRCILKMDHHCPWINNCVGMYNMKYFLLFLFYVFILCAFAFITTFMSFVAGIGFTSATSFVLSTIGAVFVLLFSFLFGIFCIIMASDLITTIYSGYTKIDRKKEVQLESTSFSRSLKEVFGGDGVFELSWLIPTTPVYHNIEDLCEYSLGINGERWTGDL